MKVVSKKQSVSAEAVKTVLIEMAVEERIPSDMNELDVEEVVAIAHEFERMSKDEVRFNSESNKLSMFISGSSNNSNKYLLARLHYLKKIGLGDDLASDHLEIWESVDAITVSDLIDSVYCSPSK